MNRVVVKKTVLREADDALCAGLTLGERFAVLRELNRAGLAAMGVDDAPLDRSAARKFTFREFRKRKGIRSRVRGGRLAGAVTSDK